MTICLELSLLHVCFVVYTFTTRFKFHVCSRVNNTELLELHGVKKIMGCGADNRYLALNVVVVLESLVTVA